MKRWARQALVATLALGCASTGLLGITAGTAAAIPVRNKTAWSVILCKFKDIPAEPQSPAFFANFFTNAGLGLGGLADYFRDQSGGRISMDGSVVTGWYTEPYTLVQEQATDRWGRIQHCVSTAASNGYSVPAGNRVVAIINGSVDAGSAGGQVLLDPGAWNVGFAAHEMGHGYGLDHSYSDDTSFQDAPWSGPGEYDDPWDEMSAMNIYAFNTANFGTSAVSLNAYQRDKLGWLSLDRILTLGADGVGSRTITLAPLEAPYASGPLLVRVPFNVGNPFNYYTVEYRRKTGWSAGIPGDTVLIHEVRDGKPYLLRTQGGDRHPVQSLNANGVQISINSLNGDAATVTVTTNITQWCVPGLVWREANAADHVCVPTATWTQTQADNAAAASRWFNGGYGPHTCVGGYVWREAFSSPTLDDVCVTVAQRSQAAADNAAAPANINPARLVYGPNTCQNGYVWREADNSDYVCVSPATRAQVAADNAAAASRWFAGNYGPHTCSGGYVWREAFSGPTLDDVCVTVAQRSQASADNSAAAGRVQSAAG